MISSGNIGKRAEGVLETIRAEEEEEEGEDKEETAFVIVVVVVVVEVVVVVVVGIFKGLFPPEGVVWKGEVNEGTEGANRG